MSNKIIFINVICILAIISCLNLYSYMNKITEEKVVSGFYENRQHFITVKDYLMTKEDNYRIDFNTYNHEIENKNVKASIRYLINKLGYESIYKFDKGESHYIVFIRGGNNNDEFGVIFTLGGKPGYGLIEELIEDNWYFHWLGRV